MSDDEMRKIFCNNGSCGRWLARVQGPTVYIYCPRCKGFHSEPLVNFVRDYEGKMVDTVGGIRFFGEAKNV